MWNEENIARLRQLWNVEGQSASLIAIEFGTSRNAIIGKVHRLGLEKRETRHHVTRSHDRPRRSTERKPRDRQTPKPRRTKRQHAPERTKSELYAMLAEAVRNTVALQAC